MQNRLTISAFLCVLLFFQPIKAQETSASFQTKHVIVLVIDGVRFTESFGDDSCRYIPNLCELKSDGVLYDQFRANGPRTTTNVGHTALVTGVYQRISNSGKAFPRNPSMFQYFMKQKDIDKNKLWAISSKGKLSIMGNTRNRKWRNRFLPSVYCGKNGNNNDYVNDRETWKQVMHVMNTYKPYLSIINLLAPDVNGHGNNWEGYLQAIRNSDAYARELWEWIQNDPEMKDQTTLIITNDHGRNEDGHKDGFISHGDRSIGNRHIFMLALGPDTKKNVVHNKKRELIDIPVTIAHILGFDMPTAKGEVMWEMFLN